MYNGHYNWSCMYTNTYAKKYIHIHVNANTLLSKCDEIWIKFANGPLIRKGGRPNTP